MLKYIAQFCPNHFIITFLVSIIGSINSVFNLLYLRYLVNSLEVGVEMNNIIILALLMLIFNLAFMLFNAVINQWLIPRNLMIINKKMQALIISKLVELDYDCYEDSEFYNNLNLAAQQSDSRAIAVLDTFANIVGNIFGISALLLLIGMFDTTILFFVFVNVIVNTLINIKTSKIMHDYYENRIFYMREIAYIQRIFYLNFYAKEMRLFTKFKDLMNVKLIKCVDDTIILLKKHSKRMLQKIFVGSTTASLTNTFIILILAFKVFYKKIKLGDFIALSNGSSQLIAQMTQIVIAIPNLYEHSIYIENFNRFMDYQPKIRNKENPLNFPKEFEIKFNNVSFSYLNKKDLVIDKLNLSIKKGEKIAIIGENGSGKSTIIKLLCRLYDPTNGVIQINKKPFSDYDLISLRNNISVVFQDIQIYALTIAENVLMRKIENIEEDIELVNYALKKVDLYEKVSRLPNGIFTILTREFEDEGEIFSGGEFQRIAISRIYIKKSSLIILDEPFSSLDPFAEYKLYNSLIEENADKSIIFITHRLANIQNVDKIYYIENGNVLEEGRHNELLDLQGKYFEMFNTQSKGYK